MFLKFLDDLEIERDEDAALAGRKFRAAMEPPYRWRDWAWFVSPEYRTFRCISTEVRPRYLAALVRTEWFWRKLSHATRGGR